MSKVKCNNCGESCVPRLWHVHQDQLFKHRRTQHLCPFCGECMYETGGDLTSIGKLFRRLIRIIGILLLGSFVSTLLEIMLFPVGLRFLANLVFILFFIYAVFGDTKVVKDVIAKVLGFLKN